jgi:hypothetical protein
MQKAIIIRVTTTSSSIGIEPKELNEHLKDGWHFVSATPFGMAPAGGGDSGGHQCFLSMLVIIEKQGADTPK